MKSFMIDEFAPDSRDFRNRFWSRIGPGYTIKSLVQSLAFCASNRLLI